jgi:hypothetical protein
MSDTRSAISACAYLEEDAMSRNSWLKRSLIGVAAVVLLSTLALTVSARVRTPSAHAAPARVTRGDVEAIFHAGFTGGSGILLHSHQVLGAPVRDVSSAVLAFFNPVHEFCVDDWHLVRIGLSNSVDNDVFFTKEQAIADLQSTTVAFVLDSTPLTTDQTPISQMSAADQRLYGLPGPTFDFQAVSIFAPDALSSGTHLVEVTVTDPAFGSYHLSKTITLDASRAGACL